MDAFKKHQLKQQERERQQAYDEAMQIGISNYALSVERLESLTQTIKFHVPDRASQDVILNELKLVMEAVNECIVPQFRTEYEARQASKNMDIVGGGVM